MHAVDVLVTVTVLVVVFGLFYGALAHLGDEGIESYDPDEYSEMREWRPDLKDKHR